MHPFGGGFVVVPEAEHLTVASNGDLAFGTGGQLVVGVGVEDRQVAEGEWASCRSQRVGSRHIAEPLGWPHHGDRDGLGLAVALIKHVAEDVASEQCRVVGDRRAADLKHLERRPVAAASGRFGGDGMQHGRHQKPVGNLFALHRLDNGGRVERLHQQVHPAAEPHGSKEVAGAMRDRPCVLADVALLHRGKRKEPVPARVEPGLVGVGHPFGRARRAAGMANDEVVVFGNRWVRIGVGKAGQPGLVVVVSDDHVVEAGDLVLDTGKRGCVACADHDRSAAGVGQHVHVGLALIAGIERNPNQVGSRRAAEEVDRFERVVFEYADSVARLEA